MSKNRSGRDYKKVLRGKHPGLCPAERRAFGRTRGNLNSEQAIGRADTRNQHQGRSGRW
jgi:hypothetical protein